MKADFVTTKKGTWAYIRKSVRINGKSTTVSVKNLGLLSEIQKRYGCEDPRQWVRDLAIKLTQDEKEGKRTIEIPFCPAKDIEPGHRPLRIGGDLLLLPLYTRLGLSHICGTITKQSKVKYDLDEILRTLVAGRILYPGSKYLTYDKSQSLVQPPTFALEDMYRALSLLSEHIDDIQAHVYLNSKKFIARRDRIIYYDCTNYFFEIEENDKDHVDTKTGEFIAGLRKRGKSKENRPNPIVQMGMFMDMDGIPLAFVVFPGNESEQTSLKPLEQILDTKFGMTDFIVSTDAGLGSESNRRYNMAEGRDYICVQSLPSLPEEDRQAAILITKNGQPAVKTEMVIKDDVLRQEEALDGFYAYATSLDDEAMLVLRARSFHHEIEHLFRTTKTLLDASPVYLSRQDRIKSHFLICFLAMVIVKILQKQLTDKYPEVYKTNPLTIDTLINTLRDIKFDLLPQHNYKPLFERTLLTDHLQQLYDIDINKEIITSQKMRATYKKLKKCNRAF